MILRTEEYRARLVEQRAEWSTYRDAEIVDRFGDPLNEYWAVRDGGLGLADRSERATPGESALAALHLNTYPSSSRPIPILFFF